MSRNTRQKEAIAKVLQSTAHPLTAQEIEGAAAEVVPGLGIATVYRALKRMQDEGQVLLVEIPGEPPRYESASKGHHHHFVCRQCGKIFDLEGCMGSVEKLAPAGFVVEDHEINLFGRCNQCH